MIKSRTGKRHASDFYPTPIGVCQSALGKINSLKIMPKTILDVGAGDGVWGRVAYEQWMGINITGIDVRPLPWPKVYRYWHIGRFEDMRRGQYDLIMGNPPFRYADQFIHHALNLLSPAGYLVFLLGLQFLGGKSRMKTLWNRIPPKVVIVGADRISFTGESPTHQHALFVWQQGYTGQPGLDWIIWGDASRVYDERENQLSLWGGES